MTFSDRFLYIEPQASWRYLALLTGAHGIGLAGLLANPAFHGAIGGFLALLLLTSLVHTAARGALLVTDDAIVRIVLSEGQYILLTRGGDRLQVELAAARVFRWLILLEFRVPGRRFQTRRVVLMNDSTGSDNFRRASVLYRYLPGASPADQKSG